MAASVFELDDARLAAGHGRLLGCGGLRGGLRRLRRGRLLGLRRRRGCRERALHGGVVAGHGAAELEAADVVGHHPLDRLDAGRPVGDADIGGGVRAPSARRPVPIQKLCAKPAVLSISKTIVSPGVTGMSVTGCPLASVKRRAASAWSAMTRGSPLAHGRLLGCGGLRGGLRRLRRGRLLGLRRRRRRPRTCPA